MSRFLTLFFAMLGIAMIMWPGGAAAQYYDPWGPYGPYDPYGAPPMENPYGPQMGYRGPREPPSCRVLRGPQGRIDYGGRLDVCGNIASRLNGHRINYECDSFCTLKLASRNVCITRDARLGFHGVSYGGPDSRNIDPKGNAVYLRRLPRQIQAWVRHHHALDSKAFTYMSGSEAISLGIRECS